MKHAFLIIAHNNPEIIKAQLEILRAPNVDFYYHFDKKMVIDRSEINQWADGHAYFIPSKKIRWGHYSQIECELRLIEAAVISAKAYDYLHLLSGVDMPIKKFTDIDAFFEMNKGKEFIHFDTPVADMMIRQRISYFHLLPGRKDCERKVNGVFVKLQKLLRIDRLKNCDWDVQKGANWFSISRNLAVAIVQDKKTIERRFRFSFCGDEMFLQTFVHNSVFRESLYQRAYNNDYKMCMRYIDWDRGNPYVFRNSDIDDLIDSEYMFARKFDCAVDSAIVNSLVNRLKYDEKDAM